MSDIKAGDVVELKSGGPKMTVQIAFELDNGQACVTAVWHSENRDEFNSQDFPVEMVAKYDPKA